MGKKTKKGLPLVLGQVDSDGSGMPRIHERNINVKVIDTGAPCLQVHASFLDLEHSFHAEMSVDVETGRIEDVDAVMAKRPYRDLCPRALDNVQKLKGQLIAPGILRQITQLVGRSEGCVHLAEIFQAAVGFTATVLINKRSGLDDETVSDEQEHFNKWLPILKNTCQVFREEPEVGK